ncbi:hypothetical protein [Nonlabens dokdonensis]|jgi:hypothetical protein|uniref:Uncharacterized protein n=2 Tax=Nonlabens dokdonensis TaxID=328515 RepID=L7WCP7_NONDD|nr:hypothetical protein [Nonlabens dokdonensis]AGC76688.1 hypothetical protein DDD_1561 [Nonlabens dokdonensis DSW-6]
MNDYKKLNLKGKVSSVKIKQFKAVENNGEIIVQSIEQNDKSVVVAIDNHFYFDRNGKTIERHWLMNNTLNRKFLYEYDDRALLRTENEYNSRGDLDATLNYQYKFNDQGQIIEQKQINGDDENDSFRKISHFENGFKIKEELYYPNDATPVEIRVFDNDQKGRVVKQTISYSENEIAEIEMTKYNKDGYPVKITTLYNDTDMVEVSEMRYLEFDKQGNCTKILILVNDQPKTILKMEYAYF